MDDRPSFLICTDPGRDPKLLVDVLSIAGYAADFTYRGGGCYKPASFEPSWHIGLIILGSSLNIHADEDKCAQERAWIDAARAKRRAVLGICFGAQLLAQTFGKNLVRGSRKVDKELTQLTLTEHAQNDPVLCHVTPQTLVAQEHYDTFQVPKGEGVVELARSKNESRPHCEAFRIGTNAYGLQFHPDVSERMLVEDGWLQEAPSAEVLAEVEKTNRAILPAWVQLARCSDERRIGNQL
jgi:GMP synthase (glutamine-hydrolysing)